jgi:farnesyl diphosphate synthase
MPAAPSPWLEAWQQYRLRVEGVLDQWLPAVHIQPAVLHEAMRYAVLNGGKRLRAVLVYASGKVVGAPLAALDGPASAIEMVHAYSLVHDDLPAMDDDDLRRGKPSCHRAFDEATAILAGDALQSLAFYILAHDPKIQNDLQQRLEMIETLALASGSRGMAGGQAMDLAAEGKSVDLTALENVYIHKTGALIRASVRLGVLAQPAVDQALLDKLDHFAKCLGLAFQIHDDILDVEGETQTLGKRSGSDIARNKPTYPSLLGVSEAKRMARELHEEAFLSLQELGEEVNLLRWLADYVIQRPN